jgi:hypothetical protein
MKAKSILGFLSFSAILLNSCLSNDVGPASDEKIVSTPELVARGEYLANHVSPCMDCHSPHFENFLGRPAMPDQLGKGGELFGKKSGFPGNLYSKNITPYALGNWTDGEIIRAVTAGVSKDGTPLFPLMPYTNFGKMAKGDIQAIVAYIRTLKPIQYDVPKRTLDFPLNFIVKTMPKPADPQPLPDRKNTVEYGKYLVNAGGCFICHTKMEKGTPLVGMDFAGGEKFTFPGRGIVESANITPDKVTGIGDWDKAHFISRFKSYNNPAAYKIPIKEKDFQTVMPWLYYNGMTEEDLGAIYDYLRTVKPISNKVERFTVLLK